ATSASSPSSVMTLPRRNTSQSTWPSSARRTESPVPASSRAVASDSSICLRTQRLPDVRGHALAVRAPRDLAHRDLHHRAHVARRRGAGGRDRRGDDCAQLLVGELRGEVLLDHARLLLLALG